MPLIFIVFFLSTIHSYSTVNCYSGASCGSTNLLISFDGSCSNDFFVLYPKDSNNELFGIWTLGYWTFNFTSDAMHIYGWSDSSCGTTGFVTGNFGFPITGACQQVDCSYDDGTDYNGQSIMIT